MLRRLKKEVEKSLPPKEETILFTGEPSMLSVRFSTRPYCFLSSQAHCIPFSHSPRHAEQGCLSRAKRQPALMRLAILEVRVSPGCV